MSLYDAAPCSRLTGDPAPGVRLMRTGEDKCACGDFLNRLSPAEARTLGADLILAANASEAQWDAPGPRTRYEADVVRVREALRVTGHADCGGHTVVEGASEAACGCGAVVPLNQPGLFPLDAS